MEQHAIGDVAGFFVALALLAVGYGAVLAYFGRRRERRHRGMLDRLNSASADSQARALAAPENKPHVFRGRPGQLIGSDLVRSRCSFCARLDTHPLHTEATHPRELDRLYVLDERGIPLMKRGTECD